MLITEKLNRLSSYNQELENLASEYQKLVDSVIPEEVKKQLADIETEFTDKKSTLNSKIAELDNQIRQSVLVLGSSVKGDKLMAVWNKGRISWDTKGLDGFAVAHPEMAAFRKEGDPTVTLRKVGKGE